MRQVLFRIPIPGTALEVPVFGYGVFVFLGFAAALWLAIRRARRARIASEHLLDLGLWMLLAGVIGGRVLFVVMFWDQMQGPLDLIAIWRGGLVLYGGVIGAMAALLVFALRHRLPLLRLLDLLAPAVILGVGIGRIGCFMNGCCWGDPTLVPWAVSFPVGSPPYLEHLQRGLVSPGFSVATGPQGPQVLSVQPSSWAERIGLAVGDRVLAVRATHTVRERATSTVSSLYAALRELTPRSEIVLRVRRADHELRLEGRYEPQPPGSVPVHPTQLYSALGGVLIALWLCQARLEERAEGLAAAALMISYGVQRFLIEILRDDLPAVALGLTLAQWISLILVTGGMVLAASCLRRKAALLSNADVTSGGSPRAQRLVPTADHGPEP